jgi:hypothetical protein
MSRTSILAILAGVGITFSGVMSEDAMAFAKAVQSANDSQLIRFANQHPASPYHSDALRLAAGFCKDRHDVNCTNFDDSVQPQGTPAPTVVPVASDSYAES